MRTLVTSILVKSGVMTHTRDLVKALLEEGLDITLALYVSDNALRAMGITKNDYVQLLKGFTGLPVVFYRHAEELKILAQRKRIQIIHAQSPLTFGDSCKLAESVGIPLVVTAHGVIDWPRLYPGVLKKAAAIIAVGPETKKSLGAKFSSRAHVIFNGIDTALFRPEKTTKTAKVREPLEVLWFGRVGKKAAQGLLALDKAIGQMKAQGKAINATVIGHAAGIRLHNMVVKGWVADPVPYLQKGMIAFARGRALREAMACGNAGFLLGQGYGGLVKEEWFKKKPPAVLSANPLHGYPPASPEDIQKDLDYFYNNYPALKKARKNAREIAVKYFDVQVMALETIQVYESLLKEKAPVKKEAIPKKE